MNGREIDGQRDGWMESGRVETVKANRPDRTKPDCDPSPTPTPLGLWPALHKSSHSFAIQLHKT